MKLYHCRVFLPTSLDYPDSTEALTLHYSHHAKEASKRDRYGNLEGLLPQRYLFPERWELIEVGASGSSVVKCLYQRPVNGLLLSLVVAVKNRNRNEWTVKTVWANSQSDAHTTLDETRYETE